MPDIRPQKPIQILIKIVVGLSIAVGLFAVIYVPILSSNIAGDITKRFRGQISINDASLSIIGPRLTLKGIIVDNPKGFSQGQAIEIKTVVINFDGYGNNPLHIKSIVVDGVTSYPEYTNTSDNLGAARVSLLSRDKMMPQGKWADPTIIDVIQIRNARMVTDDFSLALKDQNLDPIGNAEEPIMLGVAVAQVVEGVIDAQQRVLPHLAIEGIKRKAADVIDAITRGLGGPSQ